ncbi:MAG TPA: hypothetical protein VFS51_05225 [Gemmatimonadales bacterium]|nr:hypothetical protein [Gemmatimonadales bacterium]
MEQAANDTSEPVFVGGQAHWLRAEVMRRLGKDRTTLWRWSGKGRLTQRSYLGRACYPVTEVLELEAKQKEASDGS